MKQQWVFAFEDGDGKNKMLLGGKGANLCEMTQIGLNVPRFFTRLVGGVLLRTRVPQDVAQTGR